MVPKKILVVDDEEDYRVLFKRVLARAGYSVVTAATAAEGVAAYAREAPDLVLLDANLPDGDGFAVCREIRGRGLPAKREVPVLFCTVRSGLRRVREGLESGGQDYLLKPVLLDDLVARVAAALAVP